VEHSSEQIVSPRSGNITWHCRSINNNVLEGTCVNLVIAPDCPRMTNHSTVWTTMIVLCSPLSGGYLDWFPTVSAARAKAAELFNTSIGCMPEFEVLRGTCVVTYCYRSEIDAYSDDCWKYALCYFNADNEVWSPAVLNRLNFLQARSRACPPLGLTRTLNSRPPLCSSGCPPHPYNRLAGCVVFSCQSTDRFAPSKALRDLLLLAVA
jgi:hypothetical protein